MRVVSFQCSAAREAPLQQEPVGRVVCAERHRIHRLGVQRASEPLEMCREQGRVGVVQLLRQEPPTRLRPADRVVRVLDFIERRPRVRLPLPERFRRHKTRRYNSAPTLLT